MPELDISRFAIPALKELPEDIRSRIESVHQKVGFIPNIFLALAHRPNELRAFFGYHDALMDKVNGLTKAEREMIVVATSSINNCHYCVIAHGAILRIRTKNPLIADQIAINYQKADLDARQRAMIDFAVKVCTNSSSTSEEDFQLLRKHGFTEDDIWDIGAIAAFFAMSNRLANMASLRPNRGFYEMGRNPRTEQLPS